MNLKKFIDRPILSMVISVVILVAGLIGLYALSVEQYPDIAPPTISVSTTYSGANAEAVQKSVIVPLEESINGVENMTYMTSTASNTGSAQITVYFKQGTDPDMAAVNVQNKVSTATSLLPAEVTKVGVTTMKRQSSTLMIFGLYSPKGTYDETFLTNYLNINVKPQLQRISGVGEVNVMGGDYAMRIWLKPEVILPRCVHQRGDKDTARGHRAGGACGLSLLAESAFYPHPYDKHLRFSHRNVRGALRCRIQHKPAYALRSRACHRNDC